MEYDAITAYAKTVIKITYILNVDISELILGACLHVRKIQNLSVQKYTTKIAAA